MKEPHDKEIQKVKGGYVKIGNDRIRTKVKDLSKRSWLIILLLLLAMFLLDLLN
ncbi:hypothetical protein SAMN04488054_12035 [Salibacterium qingdaonense]|uniref:Uncharacterized protein n=2 Tax=Salibacterium qingdaonense TaxID=266892 RepID=A0A1I4NT02_9BACI|nr:hypothetical protein SAMN04488054_12035 [Salibacterium qingdaonense]